MIARRRFLMSSLLAAAGGVGMRGFAADEAEPDTARRPRAGRLTITDVRAIVTNPSQAPMNNFVLVKLSTSDPDVYGWGDATCTGSELAIAAMVNEHLKPALVGADPARIENLWHTLYHLPH